MDVAETKHDSFVYKTVEIGSSTDARTYVYYWFFEGVFFKFKKIF